MSKSVRLSNVFPSMVRQAWQRLIPHYLNASLDPRIERKLTETEIRSVLAASLYLGTINNVVNKGFDWDHVADALEWALLGMEDLSDDEREIALDLVTQFMNVRIIREDHPFWDWLCETWWEQYQDGPYTNRSVMAATIMFSHRLIAVLDGYEIILPP